MISLIFAVLLILSIGIFAFLFTRRAPPKPKPPEFTDWDSDGYVRRTKNGSML